tara:strand:+ start:9595 stop:10056 length:462 start_codon:yes stop_codon:yes gene_type:complete
MLAKKQHIKQGVDVLWIKPKDLDQYWNLVHFMIAEGLNFDGNPMDVKEIKNLIKKGEYQLFIMFGSDDGDKLKVFGCFVTRILALPKFKQVEVILLKGEKRELWQENAAKMIEKLGKDNKCKRVAVLARPGWRNFLEPFGWKVKRYLYQKDLI